jgi:hypothetical protein
MGHFRLVKAGLIVVGISFAFGLASFSFSKSALVNAATSSSSSSASIGGLTPDNFIYIDMAADSPWYSESYQYSFYFVGTTTGGTSVSLFPPTPLA